jgi:hypothetical protein
MLMEDVTHQLHQRQPPQAQAATSVLVRVLLWLLDITVTLVVQATLLANTKHFVLVPAPLAICGVAPALMAEHLEVLLAVVAPVLSQEH